MPFQYFFGISRRENVKLKMYALGALLVVLMGLLAACGGSSATTANGKTIITMVIQSEDVRPIMIGMNYFFQQVPQWGQIMAFATLVTIPVLALFLVFQRAFITSMASSGIKG
jgi:multiple sugar transport system permease protein